MRFVAVLGHFVLVAEVAQNGVAAMLGHAGGQSSGTVPVELLGAAQTPELISTLAGVGFQTGVVNTSLAAVARCFWSLVQVPSTKFPGHGGVPVVAFPERQAMAKLAEGPHAPVVTGVPADELETEEALAALFEEDMRPGNEIQSADCCGRFLLPLTGYPQAWPLLQTDPHAFQVRFRGVGSFDSPRRFEDDDLHGNVGDQLLENMVAVVGPVDGNVVASPQPSEASINQLPRLASNLALFLTKPCRW